MDTAPTAPSAARKQPALLVALAFAFVTHAVHAADTPPRKAGSKRTAPASATLDPSSWDTRWQAETAPVPPPARTQGKERKRARKPQIGKASYYASRFHGRRTASGHLYYQEAYTAAHRTLPLGTWVRVTNMKNQRWVVVQITDRGPYAGASRIIDLSRRSADELAMVDSGVVQVRIDVVEDYIKSAPADGNAWDARFASL